MSLDYLPIISWEEELNLKLNQSAKPGWKVFCPQETSSTMDFLKQAWKNNQQLAPILVLSQHQNSGRGRQGRKWISSGSSFIATLGLPAGQQDLTAFSLVVAVALNKILNEYNCKTQIKWPNDLLTADGRKISGILIERFENCLSVGAGINIETQEIENSAALSEFTKELPPIPEIAYNFATLLFMYYQIFQQHGFTAFYQQYQDNSLSIGSSISVSTASGKLQGLYQGVDEHGALRVLVGESLKVLTSAEISCCQENLCC